MTSITISPENPIVADHVIDGCPCWPAAAHIAYMIEHCLLISKSRYWKLRDFSAVRPLFIECNTLLDIERTAENRISIQISDSGHYHERILKSEYARASIDSTPMEAPSYLLLDELRADHDLIVPINEFKTWQKETTIHYGEMYQLQYKIWANKKRTSILGLVNVNGSVEFNKTNPFRIHPALIDTLFQQLGFLAVSQKGRFMPWFMKEIRFSGTISGPLFAQTVLINYSANNVRGTSRLFSLQGEVLLEIEGIVLRIDTQMKKEEINKSFECMHVSWSQNTQHVLPQQKKSNVSTVLFNYAISTDDIATQLYNIGRALIEASKNSDKDLYIIGENLQNTVQSNQPEPIQAALWAWYSVAKQEFRKINISLLDNDPLRLKSIQISTGINESIYQNSQSFQPIKKQAQAIARGPFLIENCLITGGLGALGLIAAKVLADLGVRDIWLLSRSASQSDVDQTAYASICAKTNVHIVACDVVDMEPLVPKDLSFDLIVHAAGVVEDALIATTSEDRIRHVLHPKVSGVVAVHKLALAHGHPKVILFSSVASTNGRPGQSAYAAANAFMDAYGAKCRKDGLYWYSLQWGLWNVGVGAPISDTIGDTGYPILTPDQGASAFRYVLTKLAPGTYEIFSILSKNTDLPNIQSTELNSGLSVKSQKNKGSEQTMKQILKAIASVLQLDYVDLMDSPTDLGIDSIMAVEITQILEGQGISIDPGMFFEVDKVAQLEKFISNDNSNHIISESLSDSSNIDSEPVVDNKEVVNIYSNYNNSVAVPTTFLEPQSNLLHGEEQRIKASEFKQHSHSSRLLRPTLPKRLTNTVGDNPLEIVIDRLSKEDRTLVANENYFYEPVIQKTNHAWVEYNNQWHLNMASYSYLGLIGHSYIEQAAIEAIDCFGTGTHGVRLLSGTTTIHRKLEEIISGFIRGEDAIVFSSGYMANVATIASIVGPGDVVIGDMFNHASIVDGCRLSGAEVRRYRHSNMEDLEHILNSYSDKAMIRLVVSDAVFSMDGDIANLPDLIQLCQQYGAILMIDEAHSLGVLGATGRGICEYYNVNPECVDIKMGTLSKTIPSVGGYVCGSRDLIFALKNNARGWMFSAAITPSQAAAAIAAFEIIDKSPIFVIQLQERIRYYRKLITEANLPTLGNDTPIVPIMTSTDADAIKYARFSQEKGLFVQPITYPTVMRNTPRLRTIVTLDHSDEDLQEAVSIFKETIIK